MISRLRRARARDGYERWTRATDAPLLGLAVLFVLVLVLPLVAQLSAAVETGLFYANVLIWLVFAVDYVARLYLATDRRRFVVTHLLDLAIVLLPMLRPLRALRVLRVLRLASVAGYAHKRATQSLHARATVYVFSAVLVSLVTGAVAIREAERGSPTGTIESFADGLWWALTTVTTVGYGDLYPTTTAGRLVSFALMLVGIALLGVVTAAIAAWFVDRLQEVDDSATEKQDESLAAVLEELRAIRERLDAHEADDSST